MTEIITEIRDNGVAVVRLDHGPTNPIDRLLVRELSATLRDLSIDDSVNSLVLTSSSTKFFSIGLAIPELFPMDREEFGVFLHDFNQLSINLFRFPKPTISAIHGHAIAGGCVLALCTDYRFIAGERKLMGLNEIKLGVTVPYPASRMLSSLVGPSIARDITESGEFFPPEESLIMGLVDELHPQDEVLEKAIEKMAVLGSLPVAAYRRIKQNRIEAVLKDIEQHRTEAEAYFIDCWFSQGTRVRLEEAMKKF